MTKTWIAINVMRNTPQLYSTFLILKSESCLSWSVSLTKMCLWIKKVLSSSSIRFVEIFLWRNLSQPRQPQKIALMNARIISACIWGDLRVISARNVFSYVQLLMSIKTAPTSSTYWIEHVRVRPKTYQVPKQHSWKSNNWFRMGVWKNSLKGTWQIRGQKNYPNK